MKLDLDPIPVAMINFEEKKCWCGLIKPGAPKGKEWWFLMS
jgi:hypothetical protein